MTGPTKELKHSLPPGEDINSAKCEQGRLGDVILMPQPSNSPDDPLNWSLWKKNLIFATVSLAAFAAQLSPNANQLTFTEQEPTYNITTPQMLNSVAAGLTGWVAGPFFIIPLVGVIGRSAVIFYSLLGIFACQLWAALMTDPSDFVSFTISRLMAGFFGAVPAILGSGYVVDLYFLHQRGAAFAIFEALIIFAVVGGGTLGGFIAQGNPWSYVFLWTLGPIGASILLVFCFLEDTTFDRDGREARRGPLSEHWLTNRRQTFFIGLHTQPPGRGRGKEFVKRACLPLQITFAPVTLLTGTYIFVALGLPILQASTLAQYLAPPIMAGGYGFEPFQVACFTFSAWAGIIAAQIWGYFFNDITPLWCAKRRGGVWHIEYRLVNTIIPSIVLPIGLGIYGAGVQNHLHFMVLALGSFLIWFSALLALPVCYNYIVECFLQHPVEASVSLNAYRVSFGLMSVFIVTDWQETMGVGWMYGLGAFLIVLVDMIMVGIIWKGHIFREWMVGPDLSIANTEDGDRVFAQAEEIGA